MNTHWRHNLKSELLDVVFSRSDSSLSETQKQARILAQHYFKRRPFTVTADVVDSLHALLTDYIELPFDIDEPCLRVEIQIPDELALPELPVPYGFKGGVARHALIYALGISEHYQRARDIDLVRIGSAWTEQDKALSEKYMAEDFRFGHGVELIRSVKRYLETRDMTWNECVLWPNPESGYRLECSVTSILDSIGRVIRPSRYLLFPLSARGKITPSVAARMLRAYAEHAGTAEPSEIRGLPSDLYIDPITLAREYDKAHASGRAVANAFLTAAFALGHLESNPETHAEAEILAELARHCPGGVDVFTTLSDTKKEHIEEFLNPSTFTKFSTE